MLRDMQMGRTGTILHRLAVVEPLSMLRARHINVDALTQQQLSAVLQGAGLRVRPVMMTSIATIAGLLPILYGGGTGSEVMSRIAAPMVGGMVSAVVLTLLVLPAAYLLVRGISVGDKRKRLSPIDRAR